MTRFCKVIALLCLAATCSAAETEYRSSNNEPSAVEIPLYAGATVESVLQALNQKGFRIKYNAEQVLPTMTLLERPKATRIDMLLREILAPYDLHADHTPYGEWKVKPIKKKKPSRA
jgi:hypothetical protein